MGGNKVGAEEGRGRPVSGYGGFVPGITAGNVFAHDYQKSLSAARQLTSDQQATAGLANPQYKGERVFPALAPGLRPPGPCTNWCLPAQTGHTCGTR